MQRHCVKCKKEILGKKYCWEHYVENKKKLGWNRDLWTKENRERQSNLMKGNKNPNFGKRGTRWKGGRVNRQGYIYVYLPEHPNSSKTGYVAEHRLIVEKKIGRYLTKQEIIHHINGIKNDNRIENLFKMNRSEHNKIHNKIRQFGMTNPIKKQIKERWDKFSEQRIAKGTQSR